MSHPNIVRLIDSFESDGKLYIFLESLKQSLFEYMSKKTFDEETAISIFREIVKAIVFLHSKKLAHRDIKPENVLLDELGNIKVCDFGFCASIEGEERRNTFCGTQQYLPPEIMLSLDQTEKVDIWCLGVLLFELLHKRVPFENKNIKIYLDKIEKKQVAFNQRCSWPVRKLISSCLEMEPKTRPSALQILNDPLLIDQKNQNRPNSVMIGDRNAKTTQNKITPNWFEPYKNQSPKNGVNIPKFQIFDNISKNEHFLKQEKAQGGINEVQMRENNIKKMNQDEKQPISQYLQQNNTWIRPQPRAMTPNIISKNNLYQNRTLIVQSNQVSPNPSFKSNNNNYSGYMMVLTNFDEKYSTTHENAKFSGSTAVTTHNQFNTDRNDVRNNFPQNYPKNVTFQDCDILFKKEESLRIANKEPQNDLKRTLTGKFMMQSSPKPNMEVRSPPMMTSQNFFQSPVKKQPAESENVLHYRIQRSPSPNIGGNFSSLQSPIVYTHQSIKQCYQNGPIRKANYTAIINSPNQIWEIPLDRNNSPNKNTSSEYSQVHFKQSTPAYFGNDRSQYQK